MFPNDTRHVPVSYGTRTTKVIHGAFMHYMIYVSVFCTCWEQCHSILTVAAQAKLKCVHKH